MSTKRNHKLFQAVVATAPVILLFSPTARATGTWLGTNSTSWGDAANWGGSIPGSTAPAGTTTFGNDGDAFIGNNSTVTLGGYATPGSSPAMANVTRIRLGYAGPGTTNGGAGTLVIDAGTLNLSQDSSIGDGADGTLIVNGGTIIEKDTKHFVAGYLNNAYIKVTAGEFIPMAKYGIEQGAGFSTVELDGGSINFANTAANQPYQINVDNLIFTGGTIAGIVSGTTINTVSGSGTIDLRDGNNASEIIFNPSIDSEFDGVVNTGLGAVGSGTGNFGSFTKVGPTALTLKAVQGYQRSTNVNGGTLILDYSINPTGIMNDVTTLSFNGGALKMEGNTTIATTDVVNRLSAVSGNSQLILQNRGASVTLDARSSTGTNTLARSLGAALDISVIGGTLGVDSHVLTHSGNSNGILPAWLTVNNFSDWGSNNGSDDIVPYAGYTAVDIGTVSPTDSTNPTKNLLLSGAQTAVPGGTSLTFNTIKMTNGAGINLSGGASLELNAGTSANSAVGILANTTGSIQGGTLTVANSGAVAVDMVVATTSDLAISSNITADGDTSGGSISLTKTGPANLTVSGANTYNGNTYVDLGALTVGSGSAIPSSSVVIFGQTNAATLNLNGHDITIGGLQNTGGTNEIVGGSAGNVNLGANTLDLNNSGNGTFAGNILGTGNLIKDNTGNATFLSSNSSYTGTTTIRGGTLFIAKLANGGTNSSIGASSNAASNVVIDGGTLAFVGRSGTSTDRLFSFGPNSGTISVFGNSGTSSNADGYYGMVNFTNTGSIAFTGSASSRTVNLSVGPGTLNTSLPVPLNPLESSFAPVITDMGGGNQTSLQKWGSGVMDLTASSTYTGQTTVNDGEISISFLPNAGQPSPIGAANTGSNDLNLNGGGLRYTGSGVSTNRLFTINNGTLDSSGTGPIAFTNSGTLNGGGTFTLAGTNTGANVFAPILTGGVNLNKIGSGVWTVTGANDYNGPTTITGGTLSVNSIANSNTPSGIGAATNDAFQLVLGGGALKYTGSGASTDHSFTLTASGTFDASGTGPINYANTGSISTNGTSGNRTLGLTGTNTGNNTMAAMLIDAGSGSVTSVAKSNAGKWILSGTNSYTGTTTIAGGTLEVTAPAQAPLLSGPGNTIINSGVLALDYNGATSPIATVYPLLKTSSSGSFTTGQIHTGNTGNANRGIGYIDNGTSQLILRYTYRGDANLDGKVNAQDFDSLAAHYGTSPATSAGWTSGDFNYDGVVNVLDFNFISANYNATALPADALPSQPALGTLVPEPATLGLASLGMALGFRRRRRG